MLREIIETFSVYLKIIRIIRINRINKIARIMQDFWNKWIVRTTWFIEFTWFARSAKDVECAECAERAKHVERAKIIKSSEFARIMRISLYLLSLLIKSRYTFFFADIRLTTCVNLLHLFAQQRIIWVDKLVIRSVISSQTLKCYN